VHAGSIPARASNFLIDLLTGNMLRRYAHGSGVDDIVISEIENWQSVFGSKQITVPV
jgi:hypothetical protein